MSGLGFFSDLDNTLIFSSNSKHYIEGYPLAHIETHSNGVGRGYISELTLRRLQQVSRQIPFIPTTTRTEAQYARILLPEVHFEYAIVGNGAVVLREGARDEDWVQTVRDVILPKSHSLKRVQQALTSIFDGAEIERRDHLVEDLFIYSYLLDPSQLTSNVMLSIEVLAAESNWKLSIQDRKLYLIPAGLTKGAATLEVARRLGITEIMAAGDSLLDVSMLDVANHAWGMQGELDRLNPYPYERIQEHGFQGTERLLEEVGKLIS